MKPEHSGATQWATDAAERICNLDGIRPHILVDGDAGHMVAFIAQIIDMEHADQHRRVAGKGGK